MDFGIYRIMNTKREDITAFLDQDLLPQVKEAFKEYEFSDEAEIQKKLADVIAGVQAAGMDPEQSSKVKELRTRLAEYAVYLTVLESEVYSSLYNFFNRYYNSGDFISLYRFFLRPGNFYPDFILWVLSEGKQLINFIDPKGVRNLRGSDDLKIAFYKTIKTIEKDLRAQDETITLNSFIIANTHLSQVSWWNGGMTREQFEECHVLFQKDYKATYISKMFTMAGL